MATSVAFARRHIDKFTFFLFGGLIQDSGFTSCTELSEEVETVETYVGGSLYPVKSPGLVKVTNITLVRPQLADSGGLDFFAWSRIISDPTVFGGADTNVSGGHFGSANPSAAELFLNSAGGYKQDLTLVQTTRAHIPVRSWRLVNAWPKKVAVTEGLDNTENARATESVTLEFDFFEPVDPASLTSRAGAIVEIIKRAIQRASTPATSESSRQSLPAIINEPQA